MEQLICDDAGASAPSLAEADGVSAIRAYLAVALSWKVSAHEHPVVLANRARQA